MAVRAYTGFIDLKYRPSRSDVVVEYLFEPNGVPFEIAAQQIAVESSIGTWTELHTLKKRIVRTLKPSVFYMDKKKKLVKIAYPSDLFEPGNMPQILSSIAGNIFGMKTLKTLRLQDISFPKKLIKSFDGPRFGIKGIRKLLGVKSRPLVGTIVKPKVGLNEKEHAQVAYEAWLGGLDVVKDDENLSNMPFNHFKKRIDLTLKALEQAEKKTGEKKVYMPNITSETMEMLRRLEYVRSRMGKYIMVDIITCGWAGLQTVRKFSRNLVIHAHRAGHGAFTHLPYQGISMLVIAKIARMIGVDQLHIGTAGVGKMEGKTKEVVSIEQEIEEDNVSANAMNLVLSQKWYGVKPVLAVASGGLHPGSVPALVRRMGTDIVIQAGGGVHWHPKGTVYGAMGMRQAIDAVMAGIPLKKYAETHLELKDAIQRFGIVK